jgi:predicted Zn-ribbon and HTH transcriptional regulator
MKKSDKKQLELFETKPVCKQCGKIIEKKDLFNPNICEKCLMENFFAMR